MSIESAYRKDIGAKNIFPAIKGFEAVYQDGYEAGHDDGYVKGYKAAIDWALELLTDSTTQEKPHE